MEYTFYTYPKCSTCRKAKKWLEEKGIDFQEINLVETPPTASTLKSIIEASQLDIKKFFNTRGKVYREMELKDKLPEMQEDEKIELLASNGMLIKRPIVFGNGKVTLGFKEEDFEQVWG